MKIILACLAFAASLAVASAAPPNIVFIMTDQHSADALSCRMGDRYLKTPALDRLAARGTFFSRAYTPNPLCMPARNSIFTGRYPHETGITDNTKTTLDAAEFVTMGTHFRQAGYRTAYLGKWHLAYDEGATNSHGFETLETGHIDAENAVLAPKFLGKKHVKPVRLGVDEALRLQLGHCVGDFPVAGYRLQGPTRFRPASVGVHIRGRGLGVEVPLVRRVSDRGEGAGVDEPADAPGCRDAVHEHASGEQTAIKHLLGRRSLEVAHLGSGVEDALGPPEGLVIGARHGHVTTIETDGSRTLVADGGEVGGVGQDAGVANTGSDLVAAPDQDPDDMRADETAAANN